MAWALRKACTSLLQTKCQHPTPFDTQRKVWTNSICAFEFLTDPLNGYQNADSKRDLLSKDSVLTLIQIPARILMPAFFAAAEARSRASQSKLRIRMESKPAFLASVAIWFHYKTVSIKITGFRRKTTRIARGWGIPPSWQ